MSKLLSSLEEMKEQLEKAEQYNSYELAVGDDLVSGLCALCLVLLDPLGDQKTYAEVRDYLSTELPRRKYSTGYCWPKGDKRPRLEWLDEQIKKLKEL